MSYTYNISTLLDTVSDTDKLKDPYLKGNIQKAVHDLVRNKKRTEDAFNMYRGERNMQDLHHLVDNYGVGSPVDIPNMRLIARRIPVLIGMALQNNLDYTVSCSSSKSLQIRDDERKQAILKYTSEYLEKMLKLGKENPMDEAFLEDIKERFGDSWQSSLEEDAFRYLQYFTRKYNFINAYKTVATDVFVAGEGYNRVYLKEKGKDPIVHKLDARHLFFEAAPYSLNVEDSKRVVYRQFMTPNQVFTELGMYMSADEKEKIADCFSYAHSYTDRVEQAIISRGTEEVLYIDGQNVQPDYASADTVEVFHVEWKTTSTTDEDVEGFDTVETRTKNLKKSEREEVYSGYLINVGEGHYVNCGRNRFVERDGNDPLKAKLSYKGMIVRGERADRPFSFLLSGKDITNLCDITHFQLNNLMAAARPGGTMTVLEELPVEFGDTPEERILKATGYEKTLGQKFISRSTEGMYPGEAGSVGFNNYGAYPANIDGNLIKGFTSYLDMLEQQADRITGLNERMLGEVEQRDGQGTTAMAIMQGELVTKEIFHDLSHYVQALLQSVLNLAAQSYDGEENKLLAHYDGESYQMLRLKSAHAFSDLDIHITDERHDKEIRLKSEQFTQVIAQNSGNLRTAFDYLHSKSLSERRRLLIELDNKASSNMQGQLEQMQEALKELEKENKQLKDKVSEKELAEIQIKKEQNQIRGKEADARIVALNKQNEIKQKDTEKKHELQEEKINVEKLQLLDGIKSNDAVNWNKTR